MATHQPICGISDDSPANNEVYAITGTKDGNWSTAVGIRQTVIPTAGKLVELRVDCVDPTSTHSRTFTLQVDTGAGFSSSALAVTVSGGSTTATSTTDVTLSQGDLVRLIHTQSGTPAASTNTRWCLVWEPTTDDEFIVMGYTGDSTSTTTAEHHMVASSGFDTWTTTEANRDVPSPIAATISNLTVAVNNSPASGSYDFEFTLNGTLENGAGDPSVNVTDATGGTDNTNTLTVAQLDTLSITCTPNTPGAAITSCQWSFVFKPDTASLAVMFGRTVIDSSANNTTENFTPCANDGASWSTSETTHFTVFSRDFTCEGLAGGKNNAVGVGNTYTCHLEVDSGGGFSAQTGVEVAITNSSTNNTEVDASPTPYTISAGDKFHYSEVPASSPSRSFSLWGLAFKEVAAAGGTILPQMMQHA